jgi:hypothetical protein
VDNLPIVAVDPSGLDIAIVVSHYSGGLNIFGHVAAGVTHRGAFSFGTKEPFGSSFTDYLKHRVALSRATVYIIHTSESQDSRFIAGFQTSASVKYHWYSNTCATAVLDGLSNAGVPDLGLDFTVLPGDVGQVMEGLVDEGLATADDIPYQATGSGFSSFDDFNPLSFGPAPNP